MLRSILARAAAVFALVAPLATAHPALAEDPAAPAWTVDHENSRIVFVFTQNGDPVEGLFRAWTADIHFDPKAPENSRVAVTVETASLYTGSDSRDETARGPAFFHVEEYPEARFTADSFTRREDGRFTADGRLTMRDTTRDVSLPFTLDIGPHPDRADTLQGVAEGETEVSRLAYGIGQGEWAGTSVVGEGVTIRIQVTATRPSGA